MNKFRIIIARIAAKEGKIPEWILLFNDGWIEIEGEGKIFIDKVAFETIDSHLKSRGVDMVFDYEHQTLKDVQAPAAGWIKELRYTEGVGIEARVVWTEKATQYILNSEYRYYSPVFMVHKKDKRVAELHSVALTNAPKTNHLKPILAKLGDNQKKREELEMKFLEKIIAALGLKKNSSEEEVVIAVTQLKEDEVSAVAKLKKIGDNPKVKEVVAKEVLEALDLEDGETSTVVASIHALKQNDKNSVSREEFNKLQGQLKERDANEVVAKAMKDGKITPDQKDWATDYAKRDLKGFNTFITKAPVIVPVENLESTDLTKTDPSLDEATLNVAKLMDVSKEDLTTHGGLSES